MAKILHRVRKRSHGRVLLFLVLVLSACQPGLRPTPGPPTLPPERIRPTQEAPAWRAASVPITRENAAGMILLGRLDPPSAGGTLYDAAFSPDGTRLVALNNEQILAWNLLTGALIFQTARAETSRLFYSPEKTEIYALKNNGTVAVLNAETGAEIARFQGVPSFGGAAAYDAINGWLAIGAADGTGVRVWDPFTRTSIVTLNENQAIVALAFSPDGERLAVVDNANAVRAYTWRDRALIAEQPTNEIILRAAFSEDGARIAYAGRNNTYVWSLDDGSVSTQSIGASEFLQYSPDGEILLGGSSSGGLYVRRPLTGGLVTRLPEVSGEIVSLGFAPGGSLLATSVFGREIALWDLTQARETSELGRGILQGTSQQIVGTSWTPDARALVLFDAAGAAYLWGIPAGPS